LLLEHVRIDAIGNPAHQPQAACCNRIGAE